MKFSYTFSTGLKVELDQKEVSEIEGIYNKEKKRHADSWKKEFGDDFIWTDETVGIPYRRAMEMFCRHDPGLTKTK